jgi:hypothetical protein
LFVLRRDDDDRQLRVHHELEIAIDLLLGPIYDRLLKSGQPLTRAFVDRLIRAAMAYGSIGA